MTSTEEITKGGNPKVWPQWLAALTIHILALLSGLVGGWTSPYLAKLIKGTESFTITTDEASWIASLFHVSRPLGSILAAVIIHKFGAKKAVLLGGLPHAVAWSCFLIKESVAWIYASRLFSGFALGMYFSTFPHYIGEIGNPRIRGALIGLAAQGSAIGYLLGNMLGAYLSMRTFAVISMVLTTIFLMFFFFFPDSPHYLVKKNRIEAAEESLKWYNRQEDVTAELEALKEYMRKPQKLSIRESFQQVLTPLNRKILIMVVFIYICMQLSGLYTIAMYLEILLTTLKVDVIAPSLVVICVGIVAIIAGLISMYTNDHFGRRTMLAVSTLGVAVNFALIGVNFLLPKQGCDISNLQWLVISEMMLYIFFLNIGLTTIPSCLLSEIFSPELKEVGTAIANVVCAVFAFIASKSYQPLLDATSEEFIFFFYALLVFSMFVYTIVVVPETKGKLLQDIQKMLMSKNQRSSNVDD